MAALIQYLGGTPVTLQFSEVYTSLQRGVADCGVTSPTSGNTAKWPEVTTHFLPLSVSGSVQGHFMNLNYWKKFSPEQQQKIAAAFKKMEDQMWDLAERVNDDAVNCNVGREPCKEGVKFKMQLVNVTPEDSNKVKSAVTATGCCRSGSRPATRSIRSAARPGTGRSARPAVSRSTEAKSRGRDCIPRPRPSFRRTHGQSDQQTRGAGCALGRNRLWLGGARALAGGTGNPGSLKGYIPGWWGNDFRELVRDDAELRGWILDGGIPRLREHPAARYFLGRQRVPMPAYRRFVSEADLEALMR